MQTTILTTTQDLPKVNEKLSSVINLVNLPIECDWKILEKINNKNLKLIAKDISNPFLMAELDKKNNTVCSLCTIESDEKGKLTITKARPDWYKLQRRIVTAGRKSELLLQACKLTADSKVIDATAGFGHDSLILASGGANVTMLEQNPLMALLLILEKQRMGLEPNWEGLMGRLDIRFKNSVAWFESSATKNKDLQADVIYLDPMFPNDSYQGAKVGKGMQILHDLALPPTAKQEQALLNLAQQAIKKNGRVVVKRPKNAPFLAHVASDESWENDVVRFDGYFNKK